MRLPSARQRLAGVVWAAGMSTLLLWAFMQPAVVGWSRPGASSQMAATPVYARPVAAPADPAGPMQPARSVRAPAAANAAALQAPRAVAPTPPVATMPAPEAAATAQATATVEERTPGVSASAVGAASAAGVAAAAPVPPRAASAPLRLDGSVIREANRASRSTVHQMAEASGRPAGDEPVGASQRLADGVAKSVKPDCFPPGGTAGLLSPLYSAYLIATDKCRTR